MTDAKAPSWTRKAATLLIAILVCEGVGALAGVATQSSVATWYPTLTKPGFTPPNWLFAPVWIVLYALMGGAAWLVGQRGWTRALVRRALGWFAVQLALNGAWSFVFFGMQSPGGGLVVIILLWGVLLITAGRFFTVRRSAGWLMVPYGAWVTYAATLNGAIWWLN